MTARTQLTETEIEEIRDAIEAGVGIRELADRYHRSRTTIAKHTVDARALPEMPPLEVAPDNPNAERWDQRAACRGTDIEIFFPAEEDRASIEVARRICAQCPVTTECLQEALDSNSQGIWAGTTDRQRNGIKRLAAAA